MGTMYMMIFGWVGAGFRDSGLLAIIVGEPAPTNFFFRSFFITHVWDTLHYWWGGMQGIFAQDIYPDFVGAGSPTIFNEYRQFR